ncbi:MAG: peptidoglycan domain protein [Muribaculaceae bacterium]|nr:peptidoglycan domain protein [Muribaculaceae bacterium]
MADINNFIPFLIYWETSVKDSDLSNEQLFAKAKTRGVTTDSYDRGGATLVGVTVGTYSDYYKRKRLPNPSSGSSLLDLSYQQWLDILKTMFWDRWQADKIIDQRIAHMLVDWVWMSGAYGVTIPQRVLGVKADGIVGEKTLAAVNSRDPQEFFLLLKRERIAHIDSICKSRPANLRFRTGWLRRINAL